LRPAVRLNAPFAGARLKVKHVAWGTGALAGAIIVNLAIHSGARASVLVRKGQLLVAIDPNECQGLIQPYKALGGGWK
jgi:hypothetical protein